VLKPSYGLPFGCAAFFHGGAMRQFISRFDLKSKKFRPPTAFSICPKPRADGGVAQQGIRFYLGTDLWDPARSRTQVFPRQIKEWKRRHEFSEAKLGYSRGKKRTDMERSAAGRFLSHDPGLTHGRILRFVSPSGPTFFQSRTKVFSAGIQW